MITSDTDAAPSPFASSKDATNSVPAGKGRKVMAAPLNVMLSQAESAIPMTIGVRLKGMTVKERGRAAGGLPPEKSTVKLPHCCKGEKVIELK